MKLSPAQVAQLERDGYLFFPGRFTPDETRMLVDAVPALYARREACNVREERPELVAGEGGPGALAVLGERRGAAHPVAIGVRGEDDVRSGLDLRD